jgi:hypothetical protein
LSLGESGKCNARTQNESKGKHRLNIAEKLETLSRSPFQVSSRHNFRKITH